MSLTPDQRATLALLLERGQRYDDLATLLGVDQAQVRARARAALTELAGADPDRNVGLTDYLLGQADPIGRADASRHLRQDVDDHALATSLTERLRELFPEASLPRIPGQPRAAGFLRRTPRAGTSSGAERPSPARRHGGLSASQTRLVAMLAGAAVLVIAAVLAITGAFGGADDDEAGSATAAATTTAQSSDDEQVQRVKLQATTGGDASGEASFGLASGDQPFVDLSIGGLDPAPADQQYVIWLMLTANQGYPLSPIAVSRQGTYEKRFPIPAAVLPVVARVRFVEVSIARSQEIRRVVREAIESTTLVLEAPGEPVLRGTIPRARAQAG